MPFSVTGRHDGVLYEETRENPSSAIERAKFWQRRGYSDVAIECDGRTYDPDAFQKLFVLTPRGLKLRTKQD